MTATGAPASLFTVSEIVHAVRGSLLQSDPSERPVTAVAVDSRRVTPDSLFVALPGERTDGHAFLAQAAGAGAAALLVSEQEAGRRGAELAGLARERGVSIIAVPDTLQGLQDLARAYMDRRRGLIRVGVTGSNGKTTTKEIIGSILSRSRSTAVNEGNLNSEIGLPLACFAVGAAHECAVFEMGMNHRGEMDALSDIVRPDLALITNIGTAHIGILGSREEIAREKKKIFARFDGRQTAFLPEDERFREFLAEGVKGRIVFFGPRSTPGYRGSESQGLGGTLIHWEEFRIRFPLFGPHNLANALGAVSVARELGVPNAEIRDGLEAVAPLFGRSQILRGPATVIVDCYNANPDSMSQALSFVSALPWKGRKIVVLGGMRELGAEEAAAHRALGESLRDAPFDAVFLAGAEMEEAWRALQGSAAAPRSRWAREAAALGKDLASVVAPGDLVLLKGSRGMELEQLLSRVAPGTSAGEGDRA
ncbi:MAG TPA: UDP-N-acetylmuramoyl-tripeptide--D-alanyl-D-alanine ligase [Spirochaetia bacterium]|nr:UDP-N-acetylmuramoyl-tripeptide--D-alanyl-D-alanine ligase [Spirochaetia bacterium]